MTRSMTNRIHETTVLKLKMRCIMNINVKIKLDCQAWNLYSISTNNQRRPCSESAIPNIVAFVLYQ